MRPSSLKRTMRSTHFFWNAPSPTAIASSTTSTCGSTLVATANARRAAIPDEYVRRGRSTNSPSSANASTSSRRPAIASSGMPSSEP